MDKTTTQTTGHQNYISQTDSRMARRVVGYLEYGNALNNLDRLVSLSDKEDLEAINSIIADHEEFAIYSKVADRIAEFKKQQNEAVTSESSDASQKRLGLKWVLALARVEFGAIIAGFTDHADPYQFVNTNAYDYQESLQLLLEGVDSHHAAMPNAKELRKSQSKMRPSNNIKSVLAYSRRARIARAMLYPLLKPGPSAYPTALASQLETYGNDLDDAQSYYNSIIRQFLAASSQQSTQLAKELGVSREFVRACSSQLAAERSEIASGRAKVTNTPIESNR